MMRSGPFFALRFIALICALTLGGFSIWVTAAEALAPRLPSFPSDVTEAQKLSAARTRTSAAALMGMIRGDLWTTAAIVEASPYLFEPDGAKRATFPQASIDTVRLLAARAAKLSPHDSRNWLLLAALAELPGASSVNTVDALKLSYYTGPSNLALTPLRLAVATRSPAIADDELKTFVSLEIQQFVAKMPALKNMLTPAYANANADGRKTIETALAAVDPAFLNTIKRR